MNNDQLISLASLVIDTKYQTRVSMNECAIADYADAIRQAGGWPFPPIKVVKQVLVDGFHRIAAARQVIAAQDTPADLRRALQNIPCERVAVDLANNDISDLALQHALAANHAHGLRPSNADKRHAVELALDKWPDRSDREIAKLTGTSHTFASRVWGDLKVATLPPESQEVTLQKDPGKVATLPLAKQQASGSDGKEIEKVVRKANGKEVSSAAKLFMMMQKQHFSGHTGLPQSLDAMAEANGGKGGNYEIANESLNSFLRATKLMRDGGSDEHKPDRKEAAKKVRSIADQHRDKLVRAIDDYHRHEPNAKERDRLVKLVQGVELW